MKKKDKKRDSEEQMIHNEMDGSQQNTPEEAASQKKDSKRETSRGAWTSLVLGIIASLGWLVPIIGLPITIVGIVLGAVNLKSKKEKGAAIAGFVVNIVFLLAAIAKGIVDLVRWSRKK